MHNNQFPFDVTNPGPDQGTPLYHDGESFRPTPQPLATGFNMDPITSELIRRFEPRVPVVLTATFAIATAMLLALSAPVSAQFATPTPWTPSGDGWDMRTDRGPQVSATVNCGTCNTDRPAFTRDCKT